MKTSRTVWLGALTFLLMMPETLPVPVLRGLVVDRFGVDELLASWFLAANMIGALLAVPWVGLHVDRTGRRRRLCLLLLAVDAVLMQAMAHPLDYSTFLLLRTFEGAAHVSALTLLMSLCADAAGERRGRVLGAIGAGLTLGVATGAAVGGLLGRHDPILTLHVASAMLAVTTLLAAWLLPHDAAVRGRPGYRELVNVVRQQPRLIRPLVLAMLDRFTVGFFTAGFPLLLAGVHAAPTPRIGMLLAAFLYPFALLSYPFGRASERWSRRRMVLYGSLVYGLGVGLVGISPVQAMWVVMPLCGIASAVMFVPTLMWLIDCAPGVARSTAIAAFHSAGSLGFLLGPLACGKLVEVGGGEQSGYTLAFAVAGATEIVGALCVVAPTLKARRRRRLPPGSAGATQG